MKQDRQLAQLDRWVIQASDEVMVIASDLKPLKYPDYGAAISKQGRSRCCAVGVRFRFGGTYW